MAIFCKAQTIDEVILEMDKIIERCISEQSKLGYFATLYRDVTVQVKQKIKEGFFEDNERMERLDVVFANRYLEAIFAYWNNQKASDSWQAAFDRSTKKSPTILQHLLLGMNAHINYDLSIAAVEVAPKESLASLKNDFNKIMDILSSMIDQVQAGIEKVSPAFLLIDKFGGRTDEKIAGFAINKARDLAWSTAEQLAKDTDESKENRLAKHDKLVALLGKAIAKPGLILSLGFYLIRRKESNDVTQVINSLKM